MEIWKDIIGHEGYYQVNNKGLIRSIDRKVFTRKTNSYKALKGRVLKTSMTGSGYETVDLCRDGNNKSYRIHRIVAENFLGGVKDGLVVHHIDNDKLNNKLENLEIVSKQRNTQAYYQTLNKSNGAVPIEDIGKIQNRVNNGEEVYRIAQEYSVNRNDIAVLCKIVTLTGKELNV